MTNEHRNLQAKISCFKPFGSLVPSWDVQYKTAHMKKSIEPEATPCSGRNNKEQNR
jgi:hypothetical protein